MEARSYAFAMSNTKRHSGYFLLDSGKGVLLFHRPSESDATRLFISGSRDGTGFSARGISGDFSRTGRKGKPFGNASSIRAGQLGDRFILSFFDRDEEALEILTSESGTEWEPIGRKKNHGHPTVFADTLSDERHAVAAFSASGRKFITLSLTDRDFRHWNARGVVLESRPRAFDVSGLAPLSAMRTKYGIVLVYSARNRDGNLAIGAAIFDALQPETLLWRSASPIWTAPKDWIGSNVTILGGANVGKYYYAYFQRDGGDIETFPMSRLWETFTALTPKKRASTKKAPLPAHRKITIAVAHRLCRHLDNPILEPRNERSWEAFSAFNAAAINLDGRIHLLYRAQGHDGISVLGHATTDDGIHVSSRSAHPVFVPSDPFDTRKEGTPKFSFPYVSGGGWGGCEDPRLTRIGDRVYMTYVAFNGSAPPGVALTSISVSDFGKRWDWEPPRLISAPGQTRKNWIIFPEKIDGKFAILHIISPRIGVEYVDSLEDPNLLIESIPRCPAPDDKDRWDDLVRGAGPPPIRTDAGWLVFYHAMDSRDPDRYKIGAMLLDLDHPETVLVRSPDPVLEPEADYENHGHKHGVVYTCGAVVKDGTLFVYYGASDRSLAVATANLDRFVSSLRAAKSPRLTTVALS